jgi:hypothetical protein
MVLAPSLKHFHSYRPRHWAKLKKVYLEIPTPPNPKPQIVARSVCFLSNSCNSNHQSAFQLRQKECRGERMHGLGTIIKALPLLSATPLGEMLKKVYLEIPTKPNPKLQILARNVFFLSKGSISSPCLTSNPRSKCIFP